MLKSILYCAFLLPLFLAAQEPGPTEPEYLGTFAYLDPVRHDLVKLETQLPTFVTRTKLMGFGGGSGGWVFKGAHSPVRIASGSKPEFVVRFESNGIEPKLLITVTALSVAKDTRQLVAAKVGVLGLNASSPNDSNIRFEVEKYGKSSYKLTPIDPLPAGEYVLRSAANQQGYCFGVGEK